MQFKDYYESLRVVNTATPKEIKKAYRKLARRYHPDVNPGDASAETRFKAINEAYEVLSDPDKRRKYDELGANWKQYEQAQATSGNPFGTGGGWSFRGQPPNNVQWNNARNAFGDDPFSEFFQTFFSAGDRFSSRPSGHRSRKHRGHNVEHEFQMTLEQAFTGVTQRLSLKSDGRTRTVDVRIPAGVADRSRVRISGEGKPGIGGASAGDLYLRVRLAPHAVFERKGRDLYIKTTVALTTAVLGGEVNISTLEGKALRLKVPSVTQPGQVFRLKGQGMPAIRKTEARGDMYATVHVELPDVLTHEAREHFEALALLEQSAQQNKKRTRRD